MAARRLHGQPQGCIDAIEKNPHGILRLLDAQCRLGGTASDAAFFEGVNTLQRDCAFLKAPRKARKLPSEAFIVAHFAGDVCYVADATSGGSWLEKNNDTLPAELQAELDGSTAPLMRRVFGADDADAGGGGGGGPHNGGAAVSNASSAGGPTTHRRHSAFNSISRRSKPSSRVFR